MPAALPTGQAGPATTALLVGLGGLAVAVVGLVLGWGQSDARPLFSWLIGLGFWLAILIGMLFLIVLFYIFDAGWSTIIRRQLEHAVGGFKWMALLFVPLLVFLWAHPNPGLLWPWGNPEQVTASGDLVKDDVLYLNKAGWLTPLWFTVRAVLYFALFIFLAETFRRISFTMDKSGDPKWYSAGRKWSGGGAALLALATTFAAVDWFKTIDYHWFSTMYGVWYFAASMWSGIAVTIMLLLYLEKGALKGIVNQAHFYYLGCMFLAFTIFWAYISFSQYFLIYSANIPEVTFWYVIRHDDPKGGLSAWYWVGWALTIGHFFIPFLYLLFYKNKFGTAVLIAGVWALAFHLLDMYWNILPVKQPLAEGGYTVQPFLPNLFDVAMVIGVGGLLAWQFLRSSATQAVIPVRDPRILESLHHHE